LTWTNNTADPFYQDEDVAYVVGYNETQDKYGTSNAATRDTEGLTLNNFPVATSDVIHTWLAFRRADGTIVSDSSYLLATVQA
jgi:hypothetical protein